LWFKGRLVVPMKEALKKKVLDEAHTLRYSIHPWSTKMYHDPRQKFWWTRMKHAATRYVSECDTCRKVKADYMKPGLSKSTHFIPVNTNYKVQKYAEVYIARVLCLHRVPKTIISDRGS
jgi:hypothetical protein